MPRAPVLAIGAIPVAVAILIAVPLLSMDRVPATTLLPGDMVAFEHTRRHMEPAPGIVERERAVASRVLEIDASGAARLVLTEGGATSEHSARLGDGELQRLRALVKETGFMSIAPRSFVDGGLSGEHYIHALRVTLNGEERRLRWSEDASGEGPAPPIVLAVREELDAIAGSLAGPPDG